MTTVAPPPAVSPDPDVDVVTAQLDAALSASLQALFPGRLSGFRGVDAPSGFNYVTRTRRGFNVYSYDQLDSTLERASHGSLQLSGVSLCVTYFTMMAATTWQLSQADRALLAGGVLADPRTSAGSGRLAAFVARGGPVDPDAHAEVSGALERLLSADVTVSQRERELLTAMYAGLARVHAACANSQRPSATNGGVLGDDAT